MSSRYASWRHIERLPVAEDVLATKMVVAPLDRPAENEVHLPTEQLPQLVLHLDQRQERWPTILTERDEYIDIAVRAEVVAQRGPEKVELRYAPAFAECTQGTLVDANWEGYPAYSRTPEQRLIGSGANV
jgi:hypothetical protein